MFLRQKYRYFNYKRNCQGSSPDEIIDFNGKGKQSWRLNFLSWDSVPYQNVCVHHIPQVMLEEVLHIHSRTSLCCLDSRWYQSFSCWERWQLHRITFKLPLQIDPFCPCLCCFLASHRGHYPTLSLFGSYIRSFSHFPCHFMIESWGWSLSTLSWSDFLKSRVFQNSLYTARNIAKSLKYCCPICLMSSGGILELYFSTSLTLVCWWTGANLRGHWVPPFLVGMGPPLPKCPASQ